MKHILEAVMERLQEQVPDLRYIAEDWGQLDFYNDAPPVKFPCALISVSNIKFESQTAGTRDDDSYPRGRRSGGLRDNGCAGSLPESRLCHLRLDGHDRQRFVCFRGR